MTERVNWRHPDYLRKATQCDVCKAPWSDKYPLRWVYGSSSVVCNRAACAETMQGWWEDTERHVAAQLASADDDE